MGRLIGDPELRRRLGEAGARNVRRFGTDAIVAQWDALSRAATAPRRRDDAVRLPDAAPASFE